MRKSKCKKTKISQLMNHPNTMEIHNLSLSHDGQRGDSCLTPKDYARSIDSEQTPDFGLCLQAIRKEQDLLDKTMGCCEVVDTAVFLMHLPLDANLLGVK